MTSEQENMIIRALSLLIAAVINQGKKPELSDLVDEAESLRLQVYIKSGQRPAKI